MRGWCRGERQISPPSIHVATIVARSPRKVMIPADIGWSRTLLQGVDPAVGFSPIPKSGWAAWTVSFETRTLGGRGSGYSHVNSRRRLVVPFADGLLAGLPFCPRYLFPRLPVFLHLISHPVTLLEGVNVPSRINNASHKPEPSEIYRLQNSVDSACRSRRSRGSPLIPLHIATTNG